MTVENYFSTHGRLYLSEQSVDKSSGFKAIMDNLYCDRLRSKTCDEILYFSSVQVNELSLSFTVFSIFEVKFPPEDTEFTLEIIDEGKMIFSCKNTEPLKFLARRLRAMVKQGRPLDYLVGFSFLILRMRNLSLN